MSEGRLELALGYAGARATRCLVRSTRKLHLWGRLEGKPIAEALALAPLLSSICSTAHGIAAARAVEQAAGLRADESHEAIRELLLGAEVLQNHLWFWFLTAPELVGGQERPLALRDARKALTAIARAVGPGWTNAGGAPDVLDRAALLQAVDAISRQLDDAQLALPSELTQLSSQPGIVGRLFTSLLEQQLEAIGASARIVTPEPAWVDAQLEADPSFAARPRGSDGVAEIGPISASHPLLTAAVGAWGRGIGARLVARLVDTCASLDQLRLQAQELRASAGVRSLPRDAGRGLGRARTSRGLLFHQVNLEKGQLLRWRVVAPTEWSFQPDGPVQQAIEGLTAPDVQTFERQVRWVVASLDPCVECSVQIEGR